MIRRAYVDGRWGQVHLRMAGDGWPLVLLHQSPISGSAFEAAMPLLAAGGARAIAVDTAGYGSSAPPPRPASIEEHADALLTVLDALGLSRVRLLGHHTGGSIAAAFAARHGDRVERLILNGVALLTAEELAFFRTFDFGPKPIEPDGGHLLAAWNQRLAGSPGWTNLEAMHRYTVEALAVRDRMGWGFEAAFAYDLKRDLEAIACPTLILTNTGEDLFEPSKRAHASRPDFAFAALDGGTHDIVDEQPEAWAAAVLAFMRG